MALIRYPLVDVVIGTPSTGPRLGAPALLPHGVTLDVFEDEALTTPATVYLDAGGTEPVSSLVISGVSIPTFYVDDALPRVFLQVEGGGTSFPCSPADATEAAIAGAAEAVDGLAVVAVGDAFEASGFPAPSVVDTNLTVDPRLNTATNWSVSTTSDFSGAGVVLTEVGNPGSVYIYEKSANAHTTGAADKWSIAWTYEGLTNVSGNAYIYLRFWQAAGPSTQSAPLAIRSVAVPLTASGRVALLNQIPPANADRATIQIGVNGLSGGGLTVRLKDVVILRSTATKIASDVAPLDGTLPYCRWTGAVDASTSERLDRMVPDTELLARYGTTDQQLLGWAAGEAYQRTGTPTVDGDGFITTTAIAWPDGGVGTFTLITKYIGPGVVAVDAYTLTHVGRGRKITQAAPTRDTAGNPTTIPALTIGAI